MEEVLSLCSVMGGNEPWVDLSGRSVRVQAGQGNWLYQTQRELFPSSRHKAPGTGRNPPSQMLA